MNNEEALAAHLNHLSGEVFATMLLCRRLLESHPDQARIVAEWKKDVRKEVDEALAKPLKDEYLEGMENVFGLMLGAKK